MKHPLPPAIKLLLDFAPLGVFFVGYKLGGVMLATALLIGATLLSLAIVYALERTVALAPLLSGIVVAVFGALTLLLKDEAFIKIKPTLINLIFAATLLIGAYGFRRGLLKPILGMAVEMREEGWLLLSKRWGLFFLFLAGLNEIIWRHFPTEFWVNFKVFGMFTLTALFALAQFRLMQRFAVTKD